MTDTPSHLDDLWARHHAEWRDSAQIVSQWREAQETDPRLLHWNVQGRWWEILAACGITLLVTREYEHLLIAMHAAEGKPSISYMPLPHPSGLAIDRQQNIVHVASTRNPNQVYDLAPVVDTLERLDVRADPPADRPLVPVRSRFYPGCLYMHDLALIGGNLYANAVGHNAVVRLHDDGRYERVWWPRCIETDYGPVFGQNYLQLNSIAAGDDLDGSSFSASTDRMSARRPGHKNFPVKQRGVIFSGATREPVVRGLTRPHSARLHQGCVWVDNSGYGEVGFADGGGGFVVAARLPGWTRGLCFHGHYAFVGTSRVIPRFRQYAPGLAVDTSVCGVHAVNLESGQVEGGVLWPNGNQIFAVDWAESQAITGFPFAAGRPRTKQRDKTFFYTFQASPQVKGASGSPRMPRTQDGTIPIDDNDDSKEGHP